MRKKIFALLAVAATAVQGFAQTETTTGKTAQFKAFNNLEVAVNVSTTGIGFDVATRVNDMVRLRTGFDFMPHFKPTLNFHILGGRYDSNGNWIESNFEDLAARMEQFTGYKVDSEVGMKGEPTFNNFKLLVDVYPFRNKHWHITAGFYLGSSKVARAYNKTEEMPALLAVGMYNNIYDKVVAGEPLYNNVYLDPDIEEALLNLGRMGIYVGRYKENGKAYMMEPDENSMVKARIKVNSFRPFLGFGYEGRLIRNNDKYTVGFDCGAMFWGGTPKILTHDGTNLAEDVTNMYGDTGDYVDIIKAFKVYPVINLRLAARIF